MKWKQRLWWNEVWFILKHLKSIKTFLRAVVPSGFGGRLLQSGFISTGCTNSIGRAGKNRLSDLFVDINLETSHLMTSFCWHHVSDIMLLTSCWWHHIVDITLLTSNYMTSYLGSILEQLPISYGPWDMPLRIAHQAYQIARGLPMGTCPWVTEEFPWRSSTDGSGRLRKPQTHPSLTWYFYHGQTQKRLS